MKISIVVPVYNVKDYLPKCIDSILVQDCSDCEIILVDDGSTDGESGAICDRYAQAHPDLIRAIHKPNGGLGDARNVGQAHATGEYILFLDSDDYIAEDTLEKLKEQGFDITLLDVHANGVVTPEQVADAIREDTCLVTIMYANNEIGTIQPIPEIGAVCRAKGVLFHTDAVQAVGHLHIDVKEQNIDMLSLSAHKFHGPKGIGVLYAKRGIALENVIHGGGQERGKRAGTENIPAIMAMTAAMEEACENIDRNADKLIPLRERLIAGLNRIPYSELNGDGEQRLPGNVNFCFEGIEGESLLLLLDDKGVCASSGSACTSGSLDPSHVLLAIGRPHEVAHGSLRLSLGEDITQAQVDELIQAVTEVVTYLRNMSPFWRDLVNGKRPHVFAE